MKASYRKPLLAAGLVACLATSASAQQLQLGKPVALDRSAAGTHHDLQSDDGSGDLHADAPVVNTEPPDGAAAEGRSLGLPQRLLGNSTASGSEDADQDDAVGGTPSKGLFPSIRGDALQVFSALAVVLGIMLSLRSVLRRSAGGLARAGRPSGVLEILARYPIGRGQQLMVLKLARRILLIHQNGSAMTTLSEVSDPDEVASLLGRIEAGSTTPREASHFGALLRQFSKEHDNALRTSARSAIPDAWDGGEIVDLTRRSRRVPGSRT
jgi:flagellar biogenesis protein FliO